MSYNNKFIEYLNHHRFTTIIFFFFTIIKETKAIKQLNIKLHRRNQNIHPRGGGKGGGQSERTQAAI